MVIKLLQSALLYLLNPCAVRHVEVTLNQGACTNTRSIACCPVGTVLGALDVVPLEMDKSVVERIYVTCLVVPHGPRPFQRNVSWSFMGLAHL